jgi:hypothetical protein
VGLFLKAHQLEGFEPRLRSYGITQLADLQYTDDTKDLLARDMFIVACRKVPVLEAAEL